MSLPGVWDIMKKRKSGLLEKSLEYLFTPILSVSALIPYPFPILLFLGGLFGSFAFEGYFRYPFIYICAGGAYLLIRFASGTA